MEQIRSIEQLRLRVDTQLQLHLNQPPANSLLQDAMRYSALCGGKRLRPVLVFAANSALKGKLAHADAAACAIECIHAYSLIHDDLPAMDDDALRRGEPSCHIAFNEATAILAGDALQALAFELLSLPSQELTSETRLSMIHTLARAAGDKGMVAGQAIDMASEGQQLDLQQLEQMHGLKTGALIRAAVRLGALTSGLATESKLEQLDRYALALGLAFQVQDDILDIESDTETLGKPRGSDIARKKATYPALLGLDGAKRKARELHDEALTALEGLGGSANWLQEIAGFVIHRNC